MGGGAPCQTDDIVSQWWVSPLLSPSEVQELVFQIASKYDQQAEEDLRNWIEEVTGMGIGTNFQLGLKDGIILCE